jgi:hypothetical protein
MRKSGVLVLISACCVGAMCLIPVVRSADTHPDSRLAFDIHDGMVQVQLEASGKVRSPWRNLD